MNTMIIKPDGAKINEATGRLIPDRPDQFSIYDWASDTWHDLRSDARRTADAAAAIDAARAAAYPPLADLADALYWQANGDESKMNTYLAAIAAVKQQLPKAT